MSDKTSESRVRWFNYILSERYRKRLIYLVGRDVETGEKKAFIIDFMPYFYVPSTEEDAVAYGIDGVPVKKIYVDSPSDVPAWREKYDKHYEADIIYNYRFKIDARIKSKFGIPEEYLDEDIIPWYEVRGE
ncbi:MAG: hypothetical protein ACTSUO_06075 [Candidatus Thorarchaeota archaeon]